MKLTAKDAKAALAKLAKATPAARSVKKKLRSNWTDWTMWVVEFEAGQVGKAARVLAAKCRAEGVRRYMDMNSLEKPRAGASVVTATNPSASVRLREQYDIARDRTAYYIDVWASR